MNTLFILRGYVVIHIINVLCNRTAIINICFTAYKWCTRLYIFRRVEVLHYVLAVPSLLLLSRIVLNVYWLYLFPYEVLVVLF